MRSKQAINRYKLNKSLREQGKVIGYPLYSFSPKLSRLVPAIPKGRCVHITANTNVGKTQFWKWYFFMSAILIHILNPNSNFKPKFIIFLLEETEEQFIDSIFSIVIFWKYKYIMDTSKLNSLSEIPLNDEETKYLDMAEESVEKILSFCTIYDNIYNPTGLFLKAREVFLKHGYREYTTLEKSILVIKENELKTLSTEQKKKFKFHKYIQNNKDEHIFVITDNVNLLEEENKNGILLSKQQTISRWSTDYAHKQIQKNYNGIIIDIVQQNAASEAQQYTNRGNSIIEKLKPSREGYGESKIIARNADLILGLFAPSFYGITNYIGYNLKEIGDNFRTIVVLKNRLGRGFREIPLFFNGAVNYFTELHDNLTEEHTKLIKKGLYIKKPKKLYIKE